ncbi:helix-turn-helix transcriptional regulator [Prosthecomicrobium pneumaticum]|uniref:helix-turn-helix transcriptional regulator n=1 Tax=Prosthecomicrobium pneumaticum TaxID=81895 RepID=UPI00160EE40B|nr:helix-turn-helix transcriptional regulator [Prosthecomicrobium pneumaticum]
MAKIESTFLGSSPLLPCQCRAARGLLDWTQEELADRAGLSRSTVREFEHGRHALQSGSAERIIAAFTSAGVELTGGGGSGAGVRFRTAVAPPGQTG